MTDNDLIDPDATDQDGLFSDADTPPVDPNKDYVSELVGEGKKYKTVNDLVYGKLNADAHISKIETENQKLRQQLEERLSLEEFYNKIKSEKSDPPSTNENTHSSEKGPENLSVEQIRSLLSEELEKKTYLQAAQQNVAMVAQEAEKALGPGYKSLLASRARELGIDQQTATGMAANNPKAFLELMIPQRPQAHAPSFPRSEVSTGAMNPSGGPGSKKTKSYFDRIKKDDPAYAKTDKFKVEMHNAAIQLGEEFFDT